MTADRVGVADAPPEMQGPGIDAPPSAEVAVHQRPIVGAFDVPRSDPAVSTRARGPGPGPGEASFVLVASGRRAARDRSPPPRRGAALPRQGGGMARRTLRVECRQGPSPTGAARPSSDAPERPAISRCPRGGGPRDRARDRRGHPPGGVVGPPEPGRQVGGAGGGVGVRSAALDRPALGPLQAGPVRIPPTSGASARAGGAGDPGSPSRRNDLRLGSARGRAGHRLDGSDAARGAALRHPRLVPPPDAGAETAPFRSIPRPGSRAPWTST